MRRTTLAAAPIRTPADLEGIELAPGQAALWWLGQSGFALRAGGTTLLLDPFLARHPDRLSPPAFPPEQATGVSAILCSHEHIDHLDAESLPGLAAASPEAKVVVPTPLVPRVLALGILPDRVLGAQPDEPFELDGLTIHPVPARHGVDVADAYTFGKELSDGLYRYLGYVVEARGLRIYHAGDTVPDEELQDRLARLAPDVALLPINGRDHYRESWNYVGNMDHREAVKFAATVGAGLLVPMHHDMFPTNLGFPAHAVDFASRHHQDLAILLPSRQHPFVTCHT
jgi:L-ascorbate 6-phosphate lactonase